VRTANRGRRNQEQRGASTYAKIEAARALNLEVVVIAPPACGDILQLADLDAAKAFLSANAAP